jgi:6-phosphogluconolactonase (cycloisomerase 2 family)
MKKHTINLLFLLAFFKISISFAQRLPFNFNAKGILALSDADMAASAFIDGNLKTTAHEVDQFSAIKWQNTATNLGVKYLNIPNSVTNFPKGLEVSHDGKTAFVVSTRDGLSRNIQQVKNILTDLPALSKIYAVDISDLSNPRLLDSIDVGHIPLSIDMRTNGDILAVVTEQANNEIVLVEWKNSRFASVNKYPSGFTGKSRTVDCEWDPTGKYLAVSLEETKQIALYYIRIFPKGVAFKQYGEPVTLGKSPSLGHWTPDGRFYLVSDSNLNDSDNSTIYTLYFDMDEGKNHRLLSTAKVGLHAEGFSISPDGQYVVTANFRESHRPINDFKFTAFSSLSLLTLNTEGGLKTIGEYEFQGIFPQSVDFDAQSSMLAVTVFDYLDLNTKSKGGIEFWQLEKGEKPTLKHTGFKISMPRGTHMIKVIR